MVVAIVGETQDSLNESQSSEYTTIDTNTSLDKVFEPVSSSATDKENKNSSEVPSDEQSQILNLHNFFRSLNKETKGPLHELEKDNSNKSDSLKQHSPLDKIDRRLRCIKLSKSNLYDNTNDVLSEYLDCIDKYPFQNCIDKVVRDVDLTIAPDKYLGNVLKLLQYVSEVMPSYKLPSYHVNILWEILGSSNCDTETRAIAGNLLLQDCSSTQTEHRQEAISKVLDFYSEQGDFIGAEGNFLKDNIDIYKKAKSSSEKQIDSIKKY